MEKKINIILGITGGVASYKACSLVRYLIDLSFDIRVIMTKKAQKFVSKSVFSVLSQKSVMTDDDVSWGASPPEHIAYADYADLIILYPLTANFISQMACGSGDNFLSLTLLAYDGPVLCVPSMNSVMWSHEIVKKNVMFLKKISRFYWLEPVEGFLACLTHGIGRSQEPEDVLEFVEKFAER